MLFSKIKVLFAHGFQAIPNLKSVDLPSPFRGRPELVSANMDSGKLAAAVKMCPAGALSSTPFALDMGKCLFCGNCARMLPDNICFTQNWHTASLTREGLVVYADVRWEQQSGVGFPIFKKSLSLRSLCAGGDGAAELELGAAGNVNFDMRRLGVEFTASPRHADGMVITGAVTSAMATAAEVTFASMPRPRLLIACGADAISGGLFVNSDAIDRAFFERHTPDLYIPGNPPHPLTFIDGIALIRG